MRAVHLGAWRLAVLTGLGLLHACGGKAASDDNVRIAEGNEVGGGGSPGPTEPGLACAAPERPLAAGLFECANGIVHRASPTECESQVPRENLGPGLLTLCNSDNDCMVAPHGWCEVHSGGSYCEYGCVTDADCGEGQLCECGSPVGKCVSAGCRMDSDCGDQGVCARYLYNYMCGPDVGYACLSEKDECRTHADCAETGDLAKGEDAGSAVRQDIVRQDLECQSTEEGRRCLSPSCPIPGRPFLVDGSERLASLSVRRDWAEARESGLLSEALAALSLEQRRQLGDAWAHIGLMEHASIAAFARFSLQLLSLGAPVALVEACNQAMVDETLHARLAFNVASQFGGSAIGPGKLNVERALDADDFESIVMNTVLEGCIGETVSAIEARELLGSAVDPLIRQVLSRIAQDEQRHADLAWQFLRWALSERPEIADKVERRVRREAGRATAGSVAQPEALWMRSFGILTGADRAALKISVMAEVVVPCVQALVAQCRRNSRDFSEPLATLA